MLNFQNIELDLTDAGKVSELISEINSSQFRDRQSMEWRGFEIYSGKLFKHVYKYVKDKHPHTYKSFAVKSINVLKKVVDKVSQSYTEGAIRTIEGDEKSAENMQKVYEAGEFNESWAKVDKVFNTHLHCLGWLVNNPDMPTEFQLRALRPFTFNVLIDPDSFKLIAVILSYPDRTITHRFGEERNLMQDAQLADGVNQKLAESPNDSAPKRKKYAIWTDKQHVNLWASMENRPGKTVCTKVDYMISPGNPNQINPINKLPFIWLSSEEDELPERPFLNPLFEETISISGDWSNLMTGAGNAATGILKYKRPAGDDKIDLLVGHTIALDLQQDGEGAPERDAEFINPNPPLQNVKECIREYTESVVRDAEIDDFKFSGEGDYNSGIDRALAMSSSGKIVSKRQKYYAKKEAELFEIMKAYDLANGTKLFSKESKLNVQYPEQKIYQPEEQKLANIKSKKELGLIEEWEKFIIMNPTMSETQAREKLEKIKAEKMENAATFGITMTNKDDNKEEEDGNQSEGSDQESQDS